MPNTFFLNDCLPAQAAAGVNVVTLFRDMVTGYRDMRKNAALDLAQCWVTSDTVDKVVLCGVTLQNLLGQLKTERELYVYASRLVTSGTPLCYEETQLAGDSELSLSFLCNGRDAHNLLVAKKLNMMAASLPVDKALCVDPLEITYTDTATGNVTNYQIHNWHVGNTAAIVAMLTPPMPAKTDTWNYLLSLLGQHGKVVWSKSFKADWDKLGQQVQELIISRFEDALNGGLLFPANANNINILKPDQKDKSSKVHELRQIGTGFRVYLECDADAIYLALYGSKTVHHGKDQEADFRIAKTKAERLRQGKD